QRPQQRQLVLAADEILGGDRRRDGGLRRERPGHRLLARDLLDGGDDAKAATADGADAALRRAVVAERLARRLDPAGERGVGYDALLPDALEDLVPGDDAMAVLQQKHQQVEHLRLDRDDLVIPPQLEGGGVDDATVDTEDHGLAAGIVSAGPSLARQRP